MVNESSLQKLRLKYYWKGVTMYDVVSLVGAENILHTKHALRKPLIPLDHKIHYVSKTSITNGSIDLSTIPITESCPPRYFDLYSLDSRCIVVSGDMNHFKAMLITGNLGTPIVLGRGSFAIRFKTPEDAISAHAWFLSDEVSFAIRDTLREKSLNMNKNTMRLTLGEVMALPMPSIEWLNDHFSHGILKAKCIGLGSSIVSSLQGANLRDPMYGDVLSLLETAVQKISGIDSAVKSVDIF